MVYYYFKLFFATIILLVLLIWLVRIASMLLKNMYSKSRSMLLTGVRAPEPLICYKVFYFLCKFVQLVYMSIFQLIKSILKNKSINIWLNKPFE